MTDWHTPFLSATPWMAWFFLGIGLPWALAMLPRRDWRDAAMVIGVALAAGPVIGTTWLFLLGTFASFTFEVAFGGTLIISLIGAGTAFKQRDAALINDGLSDDGLDFIGLRRALLVMMGLTVAAIAWDAAFWPFIRYDTLWTFGYNPKVFMMTGNIPDWIDYYPQLVPLSFTFGDLAWGAHSDHAAKAAVPWFIVSSGFAAYLFGWRVFRSRLTGWVTAGLWILLPSSAAWASSGDLEHPMAIYFTLATLFFILAWREKRYATRYAALSGFMVGGAMWTKPTSGAFVIGVGVVLVVTGFVAYRRKEWSGFRERFRLVTVTGLVSAPIGGMWYIRNILYGHNWTNLPPDYWQDLAQRSGMQLVWPYVIGVLISMALFIRHWRHGNRQAMIQIGLAFILISIALLPTMISYPDDGWTRDTSWGWVNGFREADRRLMWYEYGLLIAGIGLLISAGRSAWRELSTETRQSVWLTLGLGGPFFAVYFWSFSYHYRLTLTVMPLILAVLAALLVKWAGSFLMANRLRRNAIVVITITLGLMAPVTAAYHTLINAFDETGVRTDREKYAYANPALMWAVEQLETYAASHGKDTLAISAPGENRLAFYFPEWTINDEMLPVDVVDLDGYDIFVEVFAQFLWRTEHLLPNQVKAWLDMAYIYPRPVDGQPPADGPYDQPWPKVMVPIADPFDDGNNKFQLFDVDTDAAYVEVVAENPLDDVVFGDTMRLLGYDLSSDTLRRGETYRLKLYWQGTQEGPPPTDYSVYVHFLDPATGDLVDQRDGGLMYGLFPTRILTPGMVLQDRRDWIVPDSLPAGPVILRIGVYLPGGPRLPVMVNGEDQGDGITLETDLVIE